MRVWTVYEHAGGREISHEQIDPWKEPLRVVALDDVVEVLRTEWATDWRRVSPADLVATRFGQENQHG